MKQKHIVFDFDGTIADTFLAVLNIVNRFADTFQYKKITVQEKAILRSKKAYEIFQYLKIPLRKVPWIVIKVRKELYREMAYIKPIKGMKEVLQKLQQQGYKLGILTSNSKQNVQKFLESNALDIFDFVAAGIHVFGKDRAMKNMLKKQNILPQDIIYVGDETRDIEAAQKINIPIIAVSWGYNSAALLKTQNPNFLIHTPQELIAIGKN